MFTIVISSFSVQIYQKSVEAKHEFNDGIMKMPGISILVNSKAHFIPGCTHEMFYHRKKPKYALFFFLRP